MEFKINLTFEQIYKAACPKCQEKLLDLAAKSASLGVLKDKLKQQLETKDR